MTKNLMKNPFIVSENQINIDEKLLNKSIKLSHAYLYYSGNNDITVHTSTDIQLILIGFALDTTDGMSTAAEFLNELSSIYLNDYNEFLNRIDKLNGRYVLIVNTKDETEIYNDATALRPIFVFEQSIFSSHENLTKKAVIENTERVPEDFGVNNGYLDYTNTKEIYKFNPNLKFSFKKQSFERIFPRTDFKIADKKNIISEILLNFEEQVKWLNQSDKTLYFSVTGGYDSKVSLSLVKSMLSKLNFFTYIADLSRVKDQVRKNIYRKDQYIVENIAENLNLNHKVFSLKDYYPPEEFKEEIREHSSSNHSLNVSYLMYKEFEENSLHIKSTLYEIAKMPYPAEMDFTTDFDRLFRLSNKWQTTSFKKNIKDKRSYFDKFIERSKFKEIEDFNYNLPMMLFWESRMANWHSNITQETDHTSETFIFLNSRYILDLMMRAEYSVRKNKELLTDIVDKKWPILQYFVPNTYRTLKDQTENRSTMVLQNQNMEFSRISNIDTVIDGNTLTLRPVSGSHLFDDDVSMIIKNIHHSDRLLKLTSNYKHPVKNIFIKINDVRYSINEITDGIEVNLEKDQDLSIEYQYTRNFKNESWFDAGKLFINFSG